MNICDFSHGGCKNEATFFYLESKCENIIVKILGFDGDFSWGFFPSTKLSCDEAMTQKVLSE